MDARVIGALFIVFALLLGNLGSFNSTEKGKSSSTQDEASNFYVLHEVVTKEAGNLTDAGVCVITVMRLDPSIEYFVIKSDNVTFKTDAYVDGDRVYFGIETEVDLTYSTAGSSFGTPPVSAVFSFYSNKDDLISVRSVSL